MKKTILKIFCIIFISSVFLNTAFSSSGTTIDTSLDETKTIKQLSSGINQLNLNNNKLSTEFFLLNKNLKLKSFFRDNLENNEIKNIEFVINNYLESKNKIENTLEEKAKNFNNTSEEKKLLLNEKKDFYKDLIPYIKKDNIIEYLDYITQDIKILKERKELNEQIIIKKEIISNKVEVIEEKIKEHREYLNEKFKILVQEKVVQKVEKLKLSEKFILLTTEEKKLVLNKIIRKIKISIANIEVKIDKTDALVKKLEIYKIMLEKLQEFHDSIIGE